MNKVAGYLMKHLYKIISGAIISIGVQILHTLCYPPLMKKVNKMKDDLMKIVEDNKKNKESVEVKREARLNRIRKSIRKQKSKQKGEC